MKRFTLFFMALMACIMASAQSGLPDFSTEDSPIYYPVKFKTGGNYLADKGAGNKMQTVASESDATSGVPLQQALSWASGTLATAIINSTL